MTGAHDTEATWTQFTRKLRRYSWQHPEWWMLVLCFAAWITMLFPHQAAFPPSQAAHRHPVTPVTRRQGASDARVRWIQGMHDWTLMVVCMMFPLITVPVRATASRSLWCRRHRSIAVFLLGYMLAWIIPGAGAVTLLSRTNNSNRSQGLPVFMASTAALAVAALWQLTPTKRGASASCHRTVPLAPSGWSADRDCVGYGLLVGRDCVLSCWALMLVPILASHNPWVMAGVTSFSIADRYSSPAYLRHLLFSRLFGIAGLVLLAVACGKFSRHEVGSCFEPIETTRTYSIVAVEKLAPQPLRSLRA
jgi:predicted metal-binding membrane protein